MKLRFVIGSLGATAAVSLALLPSCKGSKSGSDATTDSATPAATTEPGASVGSLNIAEDPLQKLNLSSSLSPEIPASVKGTGTGVQAGAINVAALTSRKKSREACEIRQKIREAKMNQDQMAMNLCFVQSQKGMKAGGKYKLKFTGMGLTQDPDPFFTPGPDDDFSSPAPQASGSPAPTGDDMPEGPEGMGGEMTMSVFLDNSDTKNFKVFMCDDDKLTQKIVLSNATEKGSKGSFKSKFDMEGMSISIAGSFDNGVGSAGRQVTASQMAFAMKQGTDTMNMRSSMYLDIDGAGISRVMVANEAGNSSGDFSSAMKEIGTAKIGPNLGSALFQHTFEGSGGFFDGGDGNNTPPGGDTIPMPLTGTVNVETSRSYFDSAGNVLSKSDSKSFDDGAPFHMTEKDFPKLLPADFKVEFEASDWDCTGTTDLTVDMESAAFKECEKRFAESFSTEMCDAGDFEVGMEAEGIPSFADERGGLDDLNFEPVPPL